MNGILILNKPTGISSHQAVQKVKRITGAAKAGHGGTLDPFATGVLPILLNQATRITQYLQLKNKSYTATVLLGSATDTLDRTGQVVEEAPVPELNEAEILAVLERFTGPQKQVPPMYSARKVNGQPLYKAARKGQTIEREAKDITIHSLRLKKLDGNYLTLDVDCSAGTYIRVLARDIAKELGTLGHLQELERTTSGEMKIENAHTLEEISDAVEKQELEGMLVSMNQALSRMQEVRLTDDAVFRVCHGGPFRADDLAEPFSASKVPPGERLRVQSPDGNLIALASLEDRTENAPIFKTLRVFAKCD